MLVTAPADSTDQLTVTVSGRPTPPASTQITAPAHAWLSVVVAAAGGHHLSLTGPVGTPRAHLAKAVSRLMPDLARRDTGIVEAIWRLRPDALRLGLRRRPPSLWRGHLSSDLDLLGGGPHLQPGAVSLAHRGVLILDQAGALPSRTVAGLDDALAHKRATCTDEVGTRTYRAGFQAVFTSTRCHCLPQQHQHGVLFNCPAGSDDPAYTERLATLTRHADLHIDLDTNIACPHYDLAGKDLQGLARLADTAARRARARMRDLLVRRTADLTPELLAHPRWDTPALVRLRRHAHRRLSAGQHTAVARVALTLADLAGRPGPDHTDVHTAALLHGLHL
ncbi:ATP-binding protein [Catellatospora chokoriensis]|uniref:Magnesium chelatase ChlI-like catalytic domain-containing protein n=1 Tax=Catellatospora chokoriensis TaxID=310353 RepID=A0A8J3K708_9ACTN|nr:ATP-binding protein [Catellatospora chokoriensis]GIF94027.1 hypothetical protein Cch02nite_74710 [Catellatospora chokoriensis]